MTSRSGGAAHRFAVDIDVRRPLMEFSTAIQQMVAIARAVSFKAKLVIMDEPTSSLDEREVAVLFDVMRQLRREGVAVIFVSHRLDELFEVCDRVTIMRDGRTAMTSRMADIDKLRLVSAMLGRDLESGAQERIRPAFTARQSRARARIVLAAEGLRIGRKRAGRARRGARAGADRRSRRACSAPAAPKWRARFSAPILPDAGTSSGWAAADVSQRATPAEAIALGVGYCSEDRKADGIVPDMSVRENLTLAILPRLVAMGVVDENKQRAIVDKFMKRLAIKASSPSRRSASFPAATSRRFCWRAGSAPIQSC
jgi:monosaccharide-transporting ATPase